MKRKAPADSLDLLLDTICNTFGGVLFIAILVCLLLRSSALHVSELPSHPRDDAVEQSATLARMRARLKSLQQSMQHQQDLFAQLHDPDLDILLEQRRRLEQARQKLLKAKEGVEAKLHQQQTAVSDAEQQQVALDGDLEKARQEAKAAIEILASETAARTQTTRLPVVRSSFKQEVAFVLRYGRLYIVRRYDSGIRGGLNTAEFTILDEGDGNVTATPKPYAGLPVNATTLPAISERFSHLKPSSYYIALAVWGDSFQSFQHLKAVLVKHGYEYKLLPMENGEVISELGGDRSVQ